MAEVRYRQGTNSLEQVLRDLLEQLRGEPIPERWVDLLKRLNAEEEHHRDHRSLLRFALTHVIGSRHRPG